MSNNIQFYVLLINSFFHLLSFSHLEEISFFCSYRSNRSIEHRIRVLELRPKWVTTANVYNSITIECLRSKSFRLYLSFTLSLEFSVGKLLELSIHVERCGAIQFILRQANIVVWNIFKYPFPGSDRKIRTKIKSAYWIRVSVCARFFLQP